MYKKGGIRAGGRHEDRRLAVEGECAGMDVLQGFRGLGRTARWQKWPDVHNLTGKLYTTL